MDNLHDITVQMYSLLTIAQDCLGMLLEAFVIMHKDSHSLDPEVALSELFGRKKALKKLNSLSFSSNHEKIYDQSGNILPNIQINKLDMTFIYDILSNVEGFLTSRTKYRRGLACKYQQQNHIKKCCQACNHNCSKSNCNKCKSKGNCCSSSSDCNHPCQNCQKLKSDCYNDSTVCCQMCGICPRCRSINNIPVPCDSFKLRGAAETFKKLRNTAAHITKIDCINLDQGYETFPEFSNCKTWDELWDVAYESIKVIMKFLVSIKKIPQSKMNRMMNEIHLIRTEKLSEILNYFKQGISVLLCHISSQRNELQLTAKIENVEKNVLEELTKLEQSLTLLNNTGLESVDQVITAILTSKNTLISQFNDLLSSQSHSMCQQLFSLKGSLTDIEGKLTYFDKNIEHLVSTGEFQETVGQVQLQLVEINKDIMSETETNLKEIKHLLQNYVQTINRYLKQEFQKSANALSSVNEEIKKLSVLKRTWEITLRLHPEDLSESSLIKDVESLELDSMVAAIIEDKINTIIENVLKVSPGKDTYCIDITKIFVDYPKENLPEIEAVIYIETKDSSVPLCYHKGKSKESSELFLAISNAIKKGLNKVFDINSDRIFIKRRGWKVGSLLITLSISSEEIKLQECEEIVHFINKQIILFVRKPIVSTFGDSVLTKVWCNRPEQVSNSVALMCFIDVSFLNSELHDSMEEHMPSIKLSIASSSFLDSIKQQLYERLQDIHLIQVLLNEVRIIILEHDKGNISRNITSNNETLLHIAAKYDHIDILEYLLESGADVNLCNKQKASPLHYACITGHYEAAKLLLDHGADVNHRNIDGLAPLHMSSGNGLVKECELLLGHGANINELSKNGNTSLHLAVHCNEIEIVKILLDNGIDTAMKNKEGKTAYEIAKEKGSYRMEKVFENCECLEFFYLKTCQMDDATKHIEKEYVRQLSKTMRLKSEIITARKQEQCIPIPGTIQVEKKKEMIVTENLLKDTLNNLVVLDWKAEHEQKRWRYKILDELRDKFKLLLREINTLRKKLES